MLPVIARGAEQQEALRQKFYSAMDAAAKNAKEGNYWESGEEIRNSIKNTSGLSLAEQLKRLYNGELASSDSLYFGTTPASLDAVGLNEYPLVCNVSTLRKITTEKHNIPRRVLKNINSILSDALLAFTDGDRVGILTGDIDANGKPVLVAIQSGVMVDREPANIIKSIYGLDHPREWLKNQTNSGKQFTVLQNKERATRFLQTYGYLALVEGKNRSFDKRISQENTDVKKNFSLTADEGKVLRGAAVTLLAKDHTGLPEALFIEGDCDPLTDGGLRYAQKLHEAGVPVEAEVYDGMPHAFILRTYPQTFAAFDRIIAFFNK